jgi:hypothetical protein
MLKRALLLTCSHEAERAQEPAAGDQESEAEETPMEETVFIVIGNSRNSLH